MFENRIISLFITAASLLFTNHAYGSDEQTPPNPGSKRIERSAENSPADNFVISKRNRVMTPLRENNRPERMNRLDTPALCFSSMEKVISTYNDIELQYLNSIECLNKLLENCKKQVSEQFGSENLASEDFINEAKNFIVSAPDFKKVPHLAVAFSKSKPTSSILNLIASQANSEYVQPFCPPELKKQIQFLNIWTQSYFSTMNIASEKNELGVFVRNYSDFKTKFSECFFTLRRVVKFRYDVYKDAHVNWPSHFGPQAQETLELQKFYSTKIETSMHLLFGLGLGLQDLLLAFQQSTGATLPEVYHELLHIADLTQDPFTQRSLVRTTSHGYIELFLKVIRNKNTTSIDIQRLNNQEFLLNEIKRYFQTFYNKTQPENLEIVEMLKNKSTYPVLKLIDFEIAQSAPLINHQKNIIDGLFGDEHIEGAAALDEIGCDTFNLLRTLHANIGHEPIKPLLAIAIECCSIWQNNVYKYTQEHNNKSNAPSSLKSGRL